MLSHKSPRQKGKLSLSRFFQQFKQGDFVAVAKEHSVPFFYSDRLQGRTGRVIEKRGSSYLVEIADLGKPKRYLIKPIHLRKIQVT